jgi:hypothetical protein
MRASKLSQQMRALFCLLTRPRASFSGRTSSGSLAMLAAIRRASDSGKEGTVRVPGDLIHCRPREGFLANGRYAPGRSRSSWHSTGRGALVRPALPAPAA